MNEHRCHAETVNVNAANDVYIRSERERSSTDVPIARIKSAASSAETAWTSTRSVYPVSAAAPGGMDRCARFAVPSVLRGAPPTSRLGGGAPCSPWGRIAAMDDARARQLASLPAVHALADAAAAL